MRCHFLFYWINNKKDDIDFYSNHSYKTKSDILKVFFFLKAVRICSPKFLIKEFEHIYNSFFLNTISLNFHSSYQIKSHICIHKHTSNNMNENIPNSNTNTIKR